MLLTAQTTTTQNGIYVFNGSASTATRATDSDGNAPDGSSEIKDGTMVSVAEGTAGAGKTYMQTATPAGAIGSWSQAWSILNSGGTTYTAGVGLTLSANQFSLTSPVPIANGGTNATTAAAARTSLGAVGKFAALIGALTAGTGLDITHSLGTQDIVVSVRDATTNAVVELAWTAKDANTVTVTSDVAVSASALRIVVVG